MSRWDTSTRYGVLVMETREGRWYWSEPLQLVSFIARGRTRVEDSVSLPVSKNNRVEATRRAMARAQGWVQ
jgi:hypothetical protein